MVLELGLGEVVDVQRQSLTYSLEAVNSCGCEIFRCVHLDGLAAHEFDKELKGRLAAIRITVYNAVHREQLGIVVVP